MSENNYFHNSSIYLRALEPEDLDVLYKWENDTTLWQNGVTVNPFSRYVIKQYIEDSHLDIFQTKQLRMMIVENESNQSIGTVDLYDFDILNQRAGIGILIDKNFRMKGYAQQALTCIEKYAFEHLRLHQLYAYIQEQNTSSIALFNKVGFAKTAVLKEWLSTNKSYSDVIVMQKINNY